MKSTVQTQKIFFAMGTVNTITIFDESDDALSAAKQRMKVLDRKLSAYSHDSEIYAINSCAGISPVAVSMDTFRLIKHSVRLSRQNDGIFDITSRPLSQLWKSAIKCGQIPDDATIKEAMKLVNYKDIILDCEKHTIMLKNKGQQLDLGAIAKGYAADEVRNILHAYGVKNAVINFGGTIINMGQQRNIGIQAPFAPNGQSAFSIMVDSEKAVVSSGLYEQFCIINGRFIHHITDIRTGKPADSELLSVTLVGDKAEELDALATAVFIMGMKKGMEFLKQYNIDALFITHDKKLYFTENLKGKLRM